MMRMMMMMKRRMLYSMIRIFIRMRRVWMMKRSILIEFDIQNDDNIIKFNKYKKVIKIIINIFKKLLKMITNMGAYYYVFWKMWLRGVFNTGKVLKEAGLSKLHLHGNLRIIIIQVWIDLEVDYRMISLICKNYRDINISHQFMNQFLWLIKLGLHQMLPLVYHYTFLIIYKQLVM